jgi:hypothetical protein
MFWVKLVKIVVNLVKVHFNVTFFWKIILTCITQKNMANINYDFSQRFFFIKTRFWVLDWLVNYIALVKV